MQPAEEKKRLIDHIDEITILLNTLNRSLALQDFDTAYSIARTISVKSSAILDIISNIRFLERKRGL
ncbi:hypothetical protein [Geoglobus ahangari]